MSKAITQRIANKLEELPNEFTKRDIAKTLKASFLDVSNACIKLEKEGILKRIGYVTTGKRGRKPVIYSVQNGVI